MGSSLWNILYMKQMTGREPWLRRELTHPLSLIMSFFQCCLKPCKMSLWGTGNEAANKKLDWFLALALLVSVSNAIHNSPFSTALSVTYSQDCVFPCQWSVTGHHPSLPPVHHLFWVWATCTETLCHHLPWCSITRSPPAALGIVRS